MPSSAAHFPIRRSSAGEKRVVIRRVRSGAGLFLSASAAFGCWIVVARTWRKGGLFGVRDFRFALCAGAAFFTMDRRAGDAVNVLSGEPIRAACAIGFACGFAVMAGGDVLAVVTGGLGFAGGGEAIAAATRLGAGLA